MSGGILVCWSGGCDSTLLLHHLAREHGTPERPVRAVSFNVDQVGSSREQAKARCLLLREFKRRGLHVEVTTLSLGVEEGKGLRHDGLPQAVIWLLATQCLRPAEHLAMGYLRADGGDWGQHRGEFLSVFRALQRVADRTGDFWTPLSGTQKRGVLHQLRELGLLEMTTWCEFPERGAKPRKRGGLRRPCGACASCQAHDTALWQLDTWGPGWYWAGGTKFIRGEGGA